MKKVSWRAIQMGWILAIIFSISFIAGTYYIGFYLVSLMALAGVLYLTKYKLRCPHCNQRIKLERLTKARKKEVFCNHCEELIEVNR